MDLSIKKPAETLEKWLLVPFVSLLILLAEFSRYLSLPEITRPIFAPRNLLIVGFILAIVWLISRWLRKKSPINWYDIFYLGIPLLMGVWAIMGLIWTPADAAREYVFNFWVYGLGLTMLIGLAGRTLQNLRYLMYALLIAATIIVAIAVVEKIIDVHLPLSNLHNPFRQQWSVTSVFIGQNHLAASLALMIPLMVGFMPIWKSWWRWLALTVVGFGVVVIFLTGSTLSLLSLIIAGSVFALGYYLVSPAKIKRRIIAGAIFALFVVVIGWLLLPENVTERVSIVSQSVRDSASERVALFGSAIELIKEAPLLGHGPDAVEYLLLEQKLAIRNVHSLILEIAINFGIPVLIIAVGWFVGLLVGLWKKVHEKSLSLPILGVAASLFAFILVQAVPSTFEGVRAPFIVAGLAIALIRLKKA